MSERKTTLETTSLDSYSGASPSVPDLAFVLLEWGYFPFLSLFLSLPGHCHLSSIYLICEACPVEPFIQAWFLFLFFTTVRLSHTWCDFKPFTSAGSSSA